MAASGLAMFGGAKLDELTNGKDGGKNNKSSYKGGDMKNSDAFQRAMHNVGRPAEGYGNAQYGRPRTGAAFKKNAANARNMNDADTSMKNSAKKRHGMGVMSAKLFYAMVGGMTSDNLHDFDVMKRVGNEFRDVFSDKDFKGMESGYPYSQEYLEKMKDKALRQLKEAGADVIDKMRGVNLGGSSGSEAVRQARMNASDLATKAKESEFENEN